MSIKTKDLITPDLANQLAILGHNLKLARKRRKWSIAKVREDIRCAKGTLEDAERGKPTVSLAVYLLLIELYGFKLDLASITQPTNDLIGLSLETRPKSSAASTNQISASDF